MKTNTVLIENEILLDEITNILKEGKQVVLKVKGNSMLPYMRSEIDSVAIVRKKNVQVRDVVLAHVFCDRSKRYVLHRIIAIDGENVTLMGDGNIRGVEHCKLEDISGTAIKIIRPNGKEKSISKGYLWQALHPVRAYLLAIYHKLEKLKK